MLSGITRASTGFPVTLSSSTDNSLQGSNPNGVIIVTSICRITTALPLNLNSNPRNGLFYFNPAAFTPNAPGTLGTAGRRWFHGPGMFNADLAPRRNFQLSESKTLQFRLETFNLLSQAQFFGPAAINGNVNKPALWAGGECGPAAAPAACAQIHLLSYENRISEAQ